MNVCSACHQPITWAITEKNRRRIPLDLGFHPDGNLVVVGQVGRYSTPLVRVVEPGSDPMTYMPHFASCPKRKQKGKRQTKGAGR